MSKTNMMRCRVTPKGSYKNRFAKRNFKKVIWNLKYKVLSIDHFFLNVTPRIHTHTHIHPTPHARASTVYPHSHPDGIVVTVVSLLSKGSFSCNLISSKKKKMHAFSVHFRSISFLPSNHLESIVLSHECKWPWLIESYHEIYYQKQSSLIHTSFYSLCLSDIHTITIIYSMSHVMNTVISIIVITKFNPTITRITLLVA